MNEFIPITHSQGIHDDKLELYFTALQSKSYVIPGEPEHYTSRDLPKSIGVLHTDGQKSLFSFHLILGLHNLMQGHFGMVVEEVDLVIRQISPMPHPLDVWNDPSLITYENNNNYQVRYFGQEVGAVLRADYLRFKYGFVFLAPEETDAIDLHIISLVEADIKFSIQVTYRVANESQQHTLRLPLLFEVMFASQADWHSYHLQDGHFVADSQL